jgi:hypothetical protein
VTDWLASFDNWRTAVALWLFLAWVYRPGFPLHDYLV